jgi:hypothetical protein
VSLEQLIIGKAILENYHENRVTTSASDKTKHSTNQRPCRGLAGQILTRRVSLPVHNTHHNKPMAAIHPFDSQQVEIGSQASETATASSLTSRDDLTAIHAQSDLPDYVHKSRWQPFGIDWHIALSGYQPIRCSKREAQSHVWTVDNGLAIETITGNKRHFLCMRCYHQPRRTYKIVPAVATTGAALHLERQHSISKDGLIASLKRPNPFASNTPTKRHHALDSKVFRQALLKWHILDQVSLRKATSDAHNDLLSIVNPDTELLTITSHSTMREEDELRNSQRIPREGEEQSHPLVRHLDCRQQVTTVKNYRPLHRPQLRA